MRYALLVYGDQSSWEALSDAEKERQRAESMPGWLASFGEIAKADPSWQGRELTAASTAKTVRVRDGQTLVTDGPFAETKELLGGAFFVDLPDLDEAIRIAALIPAARTGSMEIRPIVDS
jgi:hypothetical protein